MPEQIEQYKKALIDGRVWYLNLRSGHLWEMLGHYRILNSINKIYNKIKIELFAFILIIN